MTMTQIKKWIEAGDTVKLTAELTTQMLNTVEKNGATLLHYCAEHGDLDTFKLLHTKGGDIKAMTKKRRSVVSFAAEAGNEAIVAYSIANNAPPADAVEYATESSNLAILKLVVKTPADIPADYDALNRAVWKRFFDGVDFLVSDVGIPIDRNSCDYRGSTALFDAARGGRLEMVAKLLDLHADVNKRMLDDQTALFAAINSHILEVFNLLLQHGAAIDISDEDGRTPLLYALWCNQAEMVGRLLELGADFTVRDKWGQGVAHYCSVGQADVRDVVAEFYNKHGIEADVQEKDPAILTIEEGIAEVRDDGEVKVSIYDYARRIQQIPDEIEQYQQITILNIGNLLEMSIINPKIANLQNLHTLILGYLPCVKEVPLEICEIKSLKILRISSVAITRIPPEIGRLTGLEELELGSKNARVPEEIGQLVNLKKLNIHSCDMYKVPESFAAFKHITHLKMTNSDIRHIPEFVFGLKDLVELDLSDNYIHEIPARIMQLQKLKKFNFKGNPITSPPRNRFKGSFKSLREYFITNGDTV